MQASSPHFGLLEFFRALKNGGSTLSEPVAVKSWPAPVKKSDALVLRKQAGKAVGVLTSENNFCASSSAPFPAPLRQNAFEVPRPAVVPGASSAWAPPVRKPDAASLDRLHAIRPESEFPPRAFSTEKLSARHGQFCRSC